MNKLPIHRFWIFCFLGGVILLFLVSLFRLSSDIRCFVSLSNTLSYSPVCGSTRYAIYAQFETKEYESIIQKKASYGYGYEWYLLGSSYAQQAFEESNQKQKNSFLHQAIRSYKKAKIYTNHPWIDENIDFLKEMMTAADRPVSKNDQKDAFESGGGTQKGAFGDNEKGGETSLKPQSMFDAIKDW